MESHAQRKAVLGTVGFTLFGIFFLLSIQDFSYSLPALILYVGLVINTYFSIRCFSRITPKSDTATNIIDIGLVILYLILASNFNSIESFLMITLFLFEVATLKYIVLLR